MALDDFNDKMDEALGYIGEGVGRTTSVISYIASLFFGFVGLCLVAGFGAVFLRPWLPDWVAPIYGFVVGYIVYLLSSESRLRWIFFFVVFAGLSGAWFLPIK